MLYIFTRFWELARVLATQNRVKITKKLEFFSIFSWKKGIIFWKRVYVGLKWPFVGLKWPFKGWFFKKHEKNLDFRSRTRFWEQSKMRPQLDLKSTKNYKKQVLNSRKFSPLSSICADQSVSDGEREDSFFSSARVNFAVVGIRTHTPYVKWSGTLPPSYSNLHIY